MQNDRRLTLRRIVPLALATALVLAGFGSTPAIADDDRDATPEEIARVTSHLEGRGYRYLHDIEVDDGRFELEAVNPEEEPVDLELDLVTLEILSEKLD
jgi:hypothetical protein